MPTEEHVPPLDDYSDDNDTSEASDRQQTMNRADACLAKARDALRLGDVRWAIIYSRDAVREFDKLEEAHE